MLLKRTSIRARPPTEGLPENRDAHIVRSMIGNEGRFLAYIEALLGVRPSTGAGPGRTCITRPIAERK